MKSVRVGSMLVLMVGAAPWTDGFVLYEGNPRWPEPSTTLYVDMPTEGGDVQLWNSAFDEAMAAWNTDTDFTFDRVRAYRDPCDRRDEVNAVGFADTACGLAWGSRVLGLNYLQRADDRILQTGILFNRSENWNVYEGRAQRTASGDPLYDFRRVAVHELGHALGLGHEPSNPAIMRPVIGDIEVPQEDDAAGVRTLYGYGPPIAPPPPPNDSWHDATEITGESGRAAGTNVSASWVFAGERDSLWRGADKSVFWKWTADPFADGFTTTFDTHGSDFDTILEIYTMAVGGDDPAHMTLIARSDDTYGGGSVGTLETSEVDIRTVGGETYWLRVSGWLGETGRIDLNWDTDTSYTRRRYDSTLVFPHLADGQSGEGRWRTTITLTPHQEGETRCRGRLYGVRADFGQGTSSLFSATVSFRNVWRGQTSGDGSLESGYAVVDCDGTVTGYLSFAYYDGHGVKTGEAAVFPAEEMAAHEFVVDGRDGAQVGIAIANTDDQQGEYVLELFDQDGNFHGSGELLIPAERNAAGLLGDLISPGPISGEVYRLRVRKVHVDSFDYFVSSGLEFAMIALRITGHVFSAISGRDLTDNRYGR